MEPPCEQSRGWNVIYFYKGQFWIASLPQIALCMFVILYYIKNIITRHCTTDGILDFPRCSREVTHVCKHTYADNFQTDYYGLNRSGYSGPAIQMTIEIVPLSSPGSQSQGRHRPCGTQSVIILAQRSPKVLHYYYKKFISHIYEFNI